MDKRIYKTQEAIFQAFFSLLNEKSFQKISVGDIIDRATIGRSTFYNHFPSKDDLLSAVCQHVFEHVFITASYAEHQPPTSHHLLTPVQERITHLFFHFKENDEKILTLFKLQDDYFIRSLRDHLMLYLTPIIQEEYFSTPSIPIELLNEHIISSFISCLQWWLPNAMSISSEEICTYYLALLTKKV